MGKIKEIKKKIFVTTIIIVLAFSAILGIMPSASAQKEEPIDIQVNVTLSNDEPMEGEEITIYVTVLNNESMRVDNLTLNIFIGEDIANATRIPITLEAKESLTVNTTWITEKWGQVIIAVMGIGDDNALLLNTMAGKDIWVEEKPIGDISSLILALIIIFIIVIGVSFIPSIWNALFVVSKKEDFGESTKPGGIK